CGRSIGWVGALAVFFAHALAGLISEDEQVRRAVSVAMAIAAWFVILPLSVTSLTTGLVQALGTAWGVFRHYWIVIKLFLTAVATIVLLLKLTPISALADAALRGPISTASHGDPQVALLVHAGGGLLMLLAATLLAIYKPHGLTRYGALKQLETAGPAAPDRKMPRWVTIAVSFVVILIVLIAAMLLAGTHGARS
ncbi:MAG TPA: hypothetical protein VNG69_07000, partial [Casimicrobiaceae bacterium]|nr:hypothetical protein [Casimicrobiaceae bacterium]